MKSSKTLVSSSANGNSALAKLRRNLSPRRSDEQPSSSYSSPISCSNSSEVELQRVFNYMDGNGDGKISAAELQRCVRTVGGEVISIEDAEAAVRWSDVDGDGMLGFEDFQRLMEGTASEDEKKEELKQAFGMYETEPGSGFINPSSLKRMLARLGHITSLHRCYLIIRTVDLNGDGLLSFHEFALMMR